MVVWLRRRCECEPAESSGWAAQRRTTAHDDRWRNGGWTRAGRRWSRRRWCAWWFWWARRWRRFPRRRWWKRSLQSDVLAEFSEPAESSEFRKSGGESRFIVLWAVDFDEWFWWFWHRKSRLQSPDRCVPPLQLLNLRKSAAIIALLERSLSPALHHA